MSDILHRLYWDCRSASRLLVPRYTPAGWWENDLFRVTKAGYWYEYEIKISAADFRADSQKSESEGWGADRQTRTKHDVLALSERGPSRFFFVAPLALAERLLPDVPAWAGLLGFDRWMRELKSAPVRHRTPIAGHIAEHARGVCVWRYWTLLLAKREK